MGATLAAIEPAPPAFGVLFRCITENDPRCGNEAWIDLEQLEDEDHAEYLIGNVTGKSFDPYPDAWNDEGTFEVAEVRGLGPRLAALATDAEGPFSAVLADLATAIQELEPHQQVSFLAWAESSDGSWWLPGHSEYGGQLPEDALLMWSLSELTGALAVTPCRP